MEICKEWGHAQTVHRRGSTWRPTAPARSSPRFHSPLGEICWMQQLLFVGVSFTMDVASAEPGRGGARPSPAAPAGNRRPGACGSASGRRGRPRRDWCTCPGLTLPLRVGPGGRPAPLCTQGGEPPGTTGGRTAEGYKGEDKGLSATQGETNFDIKLI